MVVLVVVDVVVVLVIPNTIGVVQPVADITVIVVAALSTVTDIPVVNCAVVTLNGATAPTSADRVNNGPYPDPNGVLSCTSTVIVFMFD